MVQMLNNHLQPFDVFFTRHSVQAIQERSPHFAQPSSPAKLEKFGDSNILNEYGKVIGVA